MSDNLAQTLSGAYEFLNKQGLDTLVGNIKKNFTGKVHILRCGYKDQNITTRQTNLQLDETDSGGLYYKYPSNTDAFIIDYDNDHIKFNKDGFIIVHLQTRFTHVNSRDNCQSTLQVYKSTVHNPIDSSDCEFNMSGDSQNLGSNITHDTVYGMVKKDGDFFTRTLVANYTAARGTIDKRFTKIKIVLFEMNYDE